MNNNERLSTYKAQAQTIRDAINSRPLTDFYRLEKSAGGLYVCPICGSGTHKNKTGALSIREQDNRVTCFGGGHCFGDNGQDTLGALRLLMQDKTEREVFAFCGYQMGTTEGRKELQPMTKNAEKSEVKTFTAEIAQYAEALPGSAGEAYLLGRGLTINTMQRFRLGYDAYRHCVTIPYNPQGSYYGRRSTIQAARPHDNLKGVPMPLFNAAALYAGGACFVVESPLCAISIAQAGGEAVAISGTGGKTRLLEQLKKKPTSAALVLCLDNDAAGRKATNEIGEALETIGAYCVNGTAAIMGDEQNAEAPAYRKDPNEVLQKDGEDAFRRAVEETAAEAVRQHRMTDQDAEEERRQHTGAGMVDAFLQAVQTRKYEPQPTGITDIDKALGGGFMRQWLVLLGAAPGAGKTALAQWIFEGMAQRGTPCIYLNLEMSREQILARSFARIMASKGVKMHSNAILQGYSWTIEQRAAITEAAEEYRETIASRMIYNPDGVTTNLDNIMTYIEAEAQRAEMAGQTAPCVVLDYLQIVSGEPREDAASVIKRAVGCLKGYAVKHNTIVFVIIAHNRASNSTGAASMESGRDTSALEYSADLQLALTFTQCLNRHGQKGKAPNELTEDERKQITLRIVKGRFGGMGREVDLYFNGETMTFSQIEKGCTIAGGPTPFDNQKTVVHF